MAETRIGVVGLGTMGAGIVEVCARSGFAVVGVEMDEAGAQRGRGHLERSTQKALDRGKLTEADRDALLARVTTTSDMGALAHCALVVEAVPEALDIKRSVFARLEDVVGEGTILATNTSSLSVTDIAAATRRPGRVVGLHFFNPAPVQRFVEIVETVLTHADVVDRVRDIATTLGKEPVVVADRAGFIANRLLLVHLNRAVAMVESGRASVADVDAAMTLGCGLPMGPLTLLDLIGLDVSLAILQTVHAETRDRTHAPAPLLRRMVAAGLLGRKTGRGFHTYDGSAAEQTSEVAGGDPIVVVGAARDALPAPVVEAAEVVVVADLAGRSGVLVTTVQDLPAVVDAAAPEAIVLACGVAPFVDHAVATSCPGRVLGLAAPRVPHGTGTLVELVPTVLTEPGLAERAAAAVRGAGLHPIVVADLAGGVVDALLHPYLDDAVEMLASGYASADDIDLAMTRGCGYPAGPVAVLDEYGLAPVLHGLHRLHAETGEPSFAPSPLLSRLVAAGRSGAGRPGVRG